MCIRQESVMVTNIMRSPNFNERRKFTDPECIILHYTGMRSGEEALSRLCDPAAQVSAHYVVHENGEIDQIVDEDKRAWHAGVSYWRGCDDLNSASIGVEIVNPGHEFGYDLFPDIQITAVVDLCRTISERYRMDRDCILAHSDIAPDRKQDPGEYFPWQRLASAGMGLWAYPVDRHYIKAEDIFNDGDILSLLHRFGYDPDCSADLLWSAFHRHYVPEMFARGDDVTKPCLESVARLLALCEVAFPTSVVA